MKHERPVPYDVRSRIDSGRKWANLPFPLDRGFIATLELPADLSADECERLCNALHQWIIPKDAQP